MDAVSIITLDIQQLHLANLFFFISIYRVYKYQLIDYDLTATQQVFGSAYNSCNLNVDRLKGNPQESTLILKQLL